MPLEKLALLFDRCQGMEGRKATAGVDTGAGQTTKALYITMSQAGGRVEGLASGRVQLTLMFIVRVQTSVNALAGYNAL